MAASSLSGCGSDTAETGKPSGDSLIVGTWFQTNAEEQTDDGPWTENPKDQCRKDNVEEYDRAGGWVWHDGANRCGTGTGTASGTWKLAPSNATVTFTYVGTPGEFSSTVDTLTATKMVLTFRSGTRTQRRDTYVK